MGASLPSLTNGDINTFLANISSAAFWAGGKKVDGWWVWPDESPFLFNNWGDGQPNSDNENCLRVSDDGYWHDYPCDFESNYICVKTAKFIK